MIKLVVSDIDGTLVDSSEQLTSAAYELSAYLKEKQVMFSLATGRVYALACHYADALELAIPFVTSNGAALTWRGNREIFRHYLPFQPFAGLIRACDAMDISIFYSYNGYERVHRLTPFLREQQEKRSQPYKVAPLDEQELTGGCFEKLCLMDGNCTGLIDEVEQMVKQLRYPFTYTRYVNRAIEIVAPGCTKAKGIEELARFLGIARDEVLCIGDDANDIEMLSQSGVSAAVANALPEAKACADYISATSHAEGAFEAVRHYLDTTL
ncbi:MAG: HAD family hydrolase [Aristaeellaceae bacterium]